MTTTFRAPAPARSLRPLALTGIVLAAFALSALAALGAVRLLAPASASTTSSSTAAANAAATAGPPFALVHASPIEITPQQVVVGRGGTLVLMNMGTDPLRLALKSTKLSASVAADDQVNMVLTGVKPGTYTLQAERPDGRPTAVRMTVKVVK